MNPAPNDPQPRLRDLGAAILIASLSAGFVVGVMWARARGGVGAPSTDVYAAHYPNIVYALRQLHLGYGLLWNNLQNCGQPFLPSTLLGLWWPLHLLFLVLDTNTVYFVAAAVHLAAGGIGTYFVCRELQCRCQAALCAGVAFALGASAIHMAVWVPTTILAAYICLPWAAYAGERLLRRPDLRNALLLGLILSLQALSGYPQISWFTYLMLGLRVMWQSLSGRMVQPVRTMGLFLFALLLPLVLAAVQLFPMIEMVRESVRSVDLSQQARSPYGVFTWDAFRQLVGMRAFGAGLGATMALIPVALAPLGLIWREQRRVSLFYILLGGLFLALAFDNRLAELLRSLPLGRSFRFPERSLWVVGFASNVGVGLGVEALWRASAQRRRRVTAVVALLAGIASFGALSPSRFTASEWALLGSLGIATAVAFYGGERFSAVLWAVAVVLTINLLVLDNRTELRLMTDGSTLLGQSQAFDVVRRHAAKQDRVYVFGRNLDFSLNVKAASVFAIPSVDDYEPQTSQRYAELFVRMLYDLPMMSINMHIFRLRQVPANRQLFDLMAARFIVADAATRRTIDDVMQPPLLPLWQSAAVVVLQNPQALPRAFFVPRLEVESDPEQLLERLASAAHDARRVALVEAAPADGFLGDTPNASGAVEIIDDRSEDLELHVQAAAAGFVSLQDQLYPGWTALVNGKEVPILRANYAFRAIRVPAGESHLVFRYRPWSVRFGTATSLAGIVVVAVLWYFGRRVGSTTFTSLPSSSQQGA